MKDTRSTEIKVGLVSIVAILLFILGITLGRGLYVSVNPVTVKIRFPNSGNIQISAPVFVNGVKRGTVSSIKNDNGSVLITADLNDINEFRKDVTARLSIMEITGGKKIEIFPGKSNEKFSPKDEIRGKTASDFADLVYMLGEIGSDGMMLIKRLDTLSASINRIVSDEQFIFNLKNTVSNTNKLAENANNLLTNNIKSIEITINNLKSITTELNSSIKQNEPKIDTLITKFDLTIDETRTLIAQTNRTIADAELIVKDLKSMTDSVRYGNGFVNKLIYDKEFSMRIDSTITNLSKFIEQVQQYGINANIRLGGRP
ncbi:MAG: MCE family protein [Ignavibacteriae bacterium]|nr:MCE family protein [Ignavibacteriota bacterium]